VENYQLLAGQDINGTYSVPDIILKEIWQRLCEEKKVEKVFYDGYVTDVEKWLEYVKKTDNHFVFVVNVKEKKICGGAWLKGLTTSTAMSHFFFLGAFHIIMTEMIKQYWKSVFRNIVLIGYTPDNNGPAIKLARLMGYTKMGQIPNGVYLAYEKKYVAASISYLDLRDGG
jgi:hypothetical protein